MDEKEQKKIPVFYDPAQKRWPRWRRSFLFLGIVATLLIVVFIVSVLVSPTLRPVTLGSRKAKLRYIPPVPALVLSDKERIARELRRSQILQEKQYQQAKIARAQTHATSSPLVAGFFVNWDDSSFTSLKTNFTKLDVLMPEWVHLDTGEGDITLDNEDMQNRVTTYIRDREPQFPIMPLINNYVNKVWESDKLSLALRNTTTRSNLTHQLLDYVLGNHYAGVSLDFENISPKDQENFTLFVEEASTVFHNAHLKVSVNVPPDDTSYRYRRIAQASDYTLLMMYDEHSATDSPGSIASIDWFTRTLTARAKDIPAEKMIVSLGNYSYDWQDGKQAEEKTFEEAVLAAHDSEGVISFDPLTLSPTYSYADENNKNHTVWMLDSTTAFNQYAVAGRIAPAGVALWRLGSEDATIWNFIDTPFPAADSQEHLSLMFKKIEYGYDLDYESLGEILRVTSLPSPGTRDVVYDTSRGLITSESYTTFPSPYVITRYGKSDHNIALTFDDGPDKTYTAPLLDILKSKNAPATFFIIGENAERLPDLLRREYAEGHEIGNHTFTHPNILTISTIQLRLELSATERIIESSIGRQSLLFRSPFAQDSEPTTPADMPPIVEISKQGYLLVGMQVDPSDWQSPPADEIVKRVIDQVQAGKGNVVLLHDSGGERAQTLIALPKIIDTLRAQGYTFVTVSELIGKSRNDIMPPMTPDALYEAHVNAVSFSIIRTLGNILRILFITGIVLGIARFIFIGTLAIAEYRRERRQKFDPKYAPTFAVVIAAFNEEKVIVQTITTLLASSYPHSFEIIVVDDGSTDRTAEVLRKEFGHDARIQIYSIANGGKSRALNYGITKSSAEIIVTLDADTVFTKETLANLVRHFVDPTIAAVAGNAKVGNRINMLTRFQALEYIVSQNLDRRAFSILNCISVVPGAVGAWRRSVLLAAGGFAHDTLAEDADVTIAIRKLGYSIRYEDKAIGLTEAPDCVRDLIKQRFRWMYGTLQVGWKHSRALFQPKYGSLGFVALPNIIVFQIIFPLISPVMDLLVVLSVISTVLTWNQHPETLSTGGLLNVLFYYALFLAVDFITSGLAFLLERNENKFLLLWLFIQRFYYRQLIYYVAIKSFFVSLKGIAVGWNKLDRKATVVVDK